MAILSLFGQQHQLRDKDTPEEQSELLALISRAEEFAQDIPDINPKERAYVLLLLKVLKEQQEASFLAKQQSQSLDRLRHLCDKINQSLEQSRAIIDLEV